MATTERYLPAGTDIVVRNPDGTVGRHRTKADTVLAADEPGPSVRCPETRNFVKSVVRKGYRSYFHESLIRTRAVPDAADATPAPPPPKTPEVAASLVFYDIPEGATDPDSPDPDRPTPLRNPTWFMRRVGVRLNLSCWAVPTARIQSILPELDRLTRAGANWNAIPFDPGAGKTILAAVVASITREITGAVGRMPESAASMGRYLETSTASPENTEKAARRRAAAVVARTAELVADLEEAARGFGIDPRTLDLARTMAAAEATRVGMEERARVYYAAQMRLRAEGGNAAVAAAMTAPDADVTTALIAADALDDVEYGAGADLRAAFTDPPEPVGAGAGADEVFDLAGAED